MTKITISSSKIHQEQLDREVKEEIFDIIKQRLIIDDKIVPCNIIDDDQLFDNIYLGSSFE